MKHIKFFLFLMLILFPSFLSAADRWYNAGGSLYWWVTWWTCCSNGVTIWSQQWWKWRNGSQSCYIRDNNAPSINVNLSAPNNTWVDDNYVTVTVSFSDAWAWVWYNRIYVNDRAVTNNPIYLTEEWSYKITAEAVDRANVNLSNGSAIFWNYNAVTKYVKIDRTEPKFSIFKDPIGWFKEKPVVNKTSDNRYIISDTWKWIGENQMETKTFTCGNPPTNASYALPVIQNTDGTYTVSGDCDGSTSDCTKNANYTPNDSKCNWSCDTGFILSWDSSRCEAKFIARTCTDSNINFPSSVYYYDTANNLQSESAPSNAVYWNAPTGVARYLWDFNAEYSASTDSYSPDISSCNYSCENGYHYEAWKCVENSAVYCCDKPFLWNTIDAWGWVEVDCNNSANFGHVACNPNPACGNRFVKDLHKVWNGSTWKYEDNDHTISAWNAYSSITAWCGNIEIFDNSNGTTCDPYYYLIYTSTGKPDRCSPLPAYSIDTAYYSGQENARHTCNNKPDGNAQYTWNSDNSNCPWTCKPWKSLVNGRCLGYEWYTGNRWSCNTSCGSGTKYRTVECRRSDGKSAPDNKCSGTKPSSSTSCSSTSGCNWYTGSRWSCSVSCGWWTKTRSVKCSSSSSWTNAWDSYCSTKWTKPSSSTSCNTQACANP